MPNTTKAPSTVLIVCATVVAVAAIGAGVLVLRGGVSDTALGLFIGLIGTVVTTLVNLGRTEQIKDTVHDLANGRMDAKIRAGVADVLADHLIDPTAGAQLDVDRARRHEEPK